MKKLSILGSQGGKKWGGGTKYQNELAEDPYLVPSTFFFNFCTIRPGYCPKTPLNYSWTPTTST